LSVSGTLAVSHLLPDQYDWDLAMADHFLRDAANHKVAEMRVAIGAHREQPENLTGGDAGYDLTGRTGLKPGQRQDPRLGKPR
jgi:hypothetical protein